MNLTTIRIIKAGLCTTIQDKGRFGYQDRGVPVSGPMDPWAHRLGNLLVGNPDDAASLEVTLGGLEAEILTDTWLAVTGANEGTCLNGRPVLSWAAFRARAGDVLTLPYGRKGARDYLSLAGGVEVPLVMGSRSTYLRGGFGGVEGRALRKGDIIECRLAGGIVKHRQVPPVLTTRYDRCVILRVIPGPQDDEVAAEGLHTFYNQTYRVTQRSDRMGIVLEGPEVRHRHGPDIISDGTAFGSIQVPGSGQPIILMADRQTTGGYVKIATVITCDLPLIGQALPGDEVRFQSVKVSEAREIFNERETALRHFLESETP